MITKLFTILFMLGFLMACGDSVVGGPASDCAEVVRIYRDLQIPVDVMGKPLIMAGGSVQIEYEGMTWMNLPDKGQATCTFSEGEGGAKMLTHALVNGTALDVSELDSVRAKLSTGSNDR